MDPQAQRTVDLARSAAVFGAFAVLVGVATLAPTGDGQDGKRVADWLRFRGDPSLVAVFNYLGVWPMVYAAVLVQDRRARVPAWPFIVGSFFVGGFVLLPYLALRRWGAAGVEQPGRIARALSGRPFAGFVLVAAWSLAAWGVSAGDPNAYVEAWKTSPLVFTMSADFCAVTIAWWALLVDDVRRHGSPTWAAVAGTIPIVGAPVWLLFRARRPRA